ncbi:translocator protein [Purpureocillium lavendulum]|uniref:Translocator protein n=1 Tax=Purpureocillium lavendulum TaxID=1247861 RepID=A0AB34G572_9HYPO|nr:translocator protein [Purpureocillium lavendulum]
MSGLVAYASSDEEEDEEQSNHVEQTSSTAVAPSNSRIDQTTATQPSRPAAPEQSAPQPSDAPQERPAPEIGPVTQSAVPLGPSLPPAEEQDDPATNDDGLPEAPSSPYTAARALIHDLTLPAVPNLDIPPSPPGSPPARASKTFEQFLKLKQTGTHFNAKLQNSAALKNPSVTDKLMDFAGLDDAQLYETTLPLDLWNPTAFPETAYVDKLKQTRERLAKRMESTKSTGSRSSVDFVPATMPSAAGGGAPPVGSLARGEKRKGDWR